MVVNKYGLSRLIPEDVKRAVRKSCGFGCIFCGNWLYQYEHIDPQFKDARTHDPAKICLLCLDHHGKVTAGRIGKQEVSDQYKHPIALSRGYANDYLDFKSKLHVVMGRIFFHEPASIISVDGVDLISMKSDIARGKLLLTAKFYDKSEKLTSEIIDNEIFVYSDNWDIQQIGTRTIIRRGRGDIALQLNIIPPDIIEVERIHMLYGSAEISLNAETGAIFIRTRGGVVMDLPNAQIITQRLSINEDKCTFDKALVMAASADMPMNKMDYRAFIDTGSIHSLPTKT